ncbi:MAG TPA: MFS transporter [Burkholderiales bacterium]|nr:MFS transporter [Burkholderiales bacterium]
MSPRNAARNFPYWRLSSFYFFYFTFVGAFSPYWSLYLKSLDFDAAEIGVLMSLLLVMRIFAPTLWGWLADHTGKRVGIVQIGAALSVLCYLGVFFGTSFWWMFVVMALISFFWSASLPLVEATTLSHLGDSSASYGQVRLWGSIGFIAAVIIIGYVLDIAPLRILLWLVLGTMAGILFFSRYIPEAEALTHHTDHLPVSQIFKRPEVLALFAACFLMVAAHGPFYTFYSLYLVAHGYSKSVIGWLWAVGVICEVVVFIFMPHLLRHFSLAQILGVSFASAVARFLLIGWLVDSAVAIFLAQVLHATTFGSYHAAAVAAIHHFFRGRHQAKGQALYTSLTFGAGGTFGALMSGYAWESLGPSLTFSMASFFALLGLILISWKFRLKA